MISALAHTTRLVIAFAVFLLAFWFFVPSVDANTTNQATTSNSQGVQKESLERLQLVKLSLESVANTLACHLHGVKQTSYEIDCLRLNSDKTLGAATTQKELEKGGVLVFSENAINMLYTPPASSTTFVNDLTSNFGITKPAHAQEEVDCEQDPGNPVCTGQGFQSLHSITNMFKLSRDIVYLVLVIAFVLVGVGIMLRVHIDPRTVMTIQNQIPKAVVAILMITFSYAIIGFLIDIMWVGTYVGINAVTAQQEGCNAIPNTPTQTSTLSGAATVAILNNPITFTAEIFGNNSGCFGHFDGISGLSLTIGGTFADIVTSSLRGILQGEASTTCLGITDGGLSGENFVNCMRAAVFQVLEIVFTIFAFLFVAFAILIALLRVWVSLLKAYIYLIIDLVFAPFWILLGIFPGSEMTIGQWFRNVIAQLAVFPATAILLVMASVIAQDPGLNTPGSGVFLPPLIGNPNIADNLGALTAFGFILLTPELSGLIRDKLKAPPSKYGAAISQGAGRGNPMGAVGFVGTLGYQISGARSVPLINKLPFLKGSPGGGGGAHPPPGGGH